MTEASYTKLKDVPWPNSEGDRVLFNGFMYAVYTCLCEQFEKYPLVPGNIVMARKEDLIDGQILRRAKLFPGPLFPKDFDSLASGSRRFSFNPLNLLKPRYRG